MSPRFHTRRAPLLASALLPLFLGCPGGPGVSAGELDAGQVDGDAGGAPLADGAVVDDADAGEDPSAPDAGSGDAGLDDEPELSDDAGTPRPDGGDEGDSAPDAGFDAGFDEEPEPQPEPDPEPEPGSWGPPLLEPASASESGAHTVTTFFNVLRQNGADPWVYKHTDGYYYYTQTTGGNVTIWRSETLSGIGYGQRKVIWTKPATGPASQDIWAPEIHFLRGKWYVYFAASNGNVGGRRMFVLENPDADPFSDGWVFKGKIADASNRWAIDGTVLEVGNSLYFIWSGWPGTTNGVQNLYIARMSDPLTISSGRVRLSTPSYAWEKVGDPDINEGPQVIVKNGVISLVYSASGSWTDSYCLGLLTASTSSNLLNAASWTKHPQPIFSSANGLHGPGHHSFTRSPDDSEDWIVYHTARWSGSGWTRQVRLQPFTWKANHTPNLGAPVPPNVPIPLPSGDPARARYEAEDMAVGGTAHAVAHASASGGKKVGYIDGGNAHLTFTVWVPRAGVHAVGLRTGNGTAGQTTSTYHLSLNGAAPRDISTVYSGWDRWSMIYLRLNLVEGENTLRITRGTGFMEFDLLDVFPVRPRVGGPLADGTYRIIADHSDKALDVGGCSTEDGANVIQWPYWGGGCQQWRLEHLGQRVYSVLAVNSGKALEVAGGAMAASANVGVFNRWGGYHQQWRLEPNDDGTYGLRARHSNQMLEVANCSSADAANVRQGPASDAACQRWRIEPR